MPRGTRDDMQVNVAGLRRNIKNLAHNYSDAQVKVREATSNDPWGPSSTLMAEIADLTYNVMAFTEIMHMIWKRLNDHGKNWRHVYKALVLMEYLIKTGTEKVALQCKENIFAIHTLKDFQYLEDGRDQGLNVREKAKQLFILLKDDERLKNERARALKAKERFAQSASAFGSDGALETPSSPAFPTMGSSSRDRADGAWCGSGGSGSVASAVALGELETARPQTAGEEELQLQLALAVSREEADRDERRRRSDNVRLQLALSQSEQDFKCPTSSTLRLKTHPVQSLNETNKFSDELPILLNEATDIFEIKLHLKNCNGNTVVNKNYSQCPSRDRPPCQEDVTNFTFLRGSFPYPASNECQVAPGEGRSKGDTPQQSHLLDLLDVNVGNPVVHDQASASGPLDPWGAPPTPPQRPQQQSADPWSSSTASPPGAGSPPGRPDPWAPTQPPLPPAPALNKDPWAPLSQQARDMDILDYPLTMSQSPLQNMLSSPSSDLEFDMITNRSRSAQQNGSSHNINNNHSNGGTMSPDPFDLTLLGDQMGASNANGMGFPPKKTPQSFLGENSALVNLDNLIKPTNGTGNEPLFGASTVTSLAHMPANPFTAEVQQSRPNLFQNQTQPRLTMNEIKQQPFATVSVDQDPWAPAPTTNSPWAPVSSNPKSTTPNPFLS